MQGKAAKQVETRCKQPRMKGAGQPTACTKIRKNILYVTYFEHKEDTSEEGEHKLSSCETGTGRCVEAAASVNHPQDLMS